MSLKICPFFGCLPFSTFIRLNQQWKNHLKSNIHRSLYSSGWKIYVGSDNSKIEQQWIIFICILLELFLYVDNLYKVVVSFSHIILSVSFLPLPWACSEVSLLLVHSCCKIVCQHSTSFSSLVREHENIGNCIVWLFFNLKA